MVNLMLSHWLGCQQCSWKLYITYGASLRKRFPDYPRYCVEGRQERFLYFEEKKTGRQTAVPICINTFTVDKFLTGNGILNPGDREEDDQSSEWRSLPRHHNPLHQRGREIILGKFSLFQLYDQSCIELFKNLCWYYYLYRALALLFPALVPSLVWRPWWSLLGQSGAGTLPTVANANPPSKCFLF